MIYATSGKPLHLLLRGVRWLWLMDSTGRTEMLKCGFHNQLPLPYFFHISKLSQHLLPLATFMFGRGHRSWTFAKVDPTDDFAKHYDDVTMSLMASQITSLTIVYSTVYSGADQRKHQSSATLAFVRGIHRGPVNSPHKWPVTRKMFPFDDVIMSKMSQREKSLNKVKKKRSKPHTLLTLMISRKITLDVWNKFILTDVTYLDEISNIHVTIIH